MSRLLFINRVFPPGEGATGQLLRELAVHMARRGHEVTVLAAALPPGEAEENLPGIRVVRYGSPAVNGSGLRTKALNYLRQYPGLAWRLRRMPPMDVWVSMTDPPMQAVVVAQLKPPGTRLLHWAQDVYPEVAEELGVLPRGGRAARICRRLMLRSLRGHDTVVPVGRCMAERLHGRDPDGPPLEAIPNWAPLPAATDELAIQRYTYRRRLSPEDRLLVMYSGNFGRAHPLEAVADAVRETADTCARLHWAFIGSGPKFDELRYALTRLGTTTFLPPQPWESLRASLSAADVHLAVMDPATIGLVVPSKVYGAMALGKPCIFLGPASCEVARLIKENGAGLVIEEATGPALAKALHRIYSRPATWEAVQGRASAAATAAAAAAKERSLDLWTSLLEGSPAAPAPATLRS